MFALKTKGPRYRDQLPLFVSQSMRDQLPRPTYSIKSMYINVEVGLAGPTLSPYMDGNHWYWERACGFLRSCKNLCNNEVTVWCNEASHQVRGKDIDQKIDRLLEMIMDIKSADEAVFSELTIRKATTLTPLYCTRQITGIIVPCREEFLGSIEDTPEHSIAPRALLRSDCERLPKGQNKSGHRITRLRQSMSSADETGRSLNMADSKILRSDGKCADLTKPHLPIPFLPQAISKV